MDSNYFGELNMGNERGNGSSNSSRKGKKNNQDKPKQPQRGLGVAQLEKIRIHGQIASGYHPPQHGSYPSTFNNMRLSEYERTNTRYHDSQPTRTRWEHAILKTHSSAQPITGSLLNLYDSQQHIETKKHRSDSVGSSSQNYESSDPQEPDLELRLSL
ncbi:hypothetical protein TanjilG_06838 [Lupinus angustifolius]|uniref:Uncharacterized protein n=1 Tax=Lupinus angustifolius TaxID=3871 RepID=A0A1J7G667_LUPAN|nr:hypothetical protein TanjilG_06838 [Lupinus angustifolius]